MNDENQPDHQARMDWIRWGARVLWIIWGALILSLGVYLFVVLNHSDSAEISAAQSSELIKTLLPAFVFGSIIQAVVALAIRYFMFSKNYFMYSKKDKSRKLESLHVVSIIYAATCIFSWAMIESIAIYGFVLSTLDAGEMTYYVVFMVPALLLLLFSYPKLPEVLDVHAQK